MDFRRTLLLGDLGNRFITLPLASEFLAHRLALPGSGHKCETIALVHVVGNRQRLDAPGPKPVHPVPEICGVIGITCTEGAVRDTIAEHNVPVHVTPTA